MFWDAFQIEQLIKHIIAMESTVYFSHARLTAADNYRSLARRRGSKLDHMVWTFSDRRTAPRGAKPRVARTCTRSKR